MNIKNSPPRTLNNDTELKINDSLFKEMFKRYRDETYHFMVNQRDTVLRENSKSFYKYNQILNSSLTLKHQNK